MSTPDTEDQKSRCPPPKKNPNHRTSRAYSRSAIRWTNHTLRKATLHPAQPTVHHGPSQPPPTRRIQIQRRACPGNKPSGAPASESWDPASTHLHLVGVLAAAHHSHRLDPVAVAVDDSERCARVVPPHHQLAVRGDSNHRVGQRHLRSRAARGGVKEEAGRERLSVDAKHNGCQPQQRRFLTANPRQEPVSF